MIELIFNRLNRSVNYPIEACMFSLLFARGGNAELPNGFTNTNQFVEYLYLCEVKTHFECFDGLEG